MFDESSIRIVCYSSVITTIGTTKDVDVISLEHSSKIKSQDIRAMISGEKSAGQFEFIENKLSLFKTHYFSATSR
jgi:hypothetical protein